MHAEGREQASNEKFACCFYIGYKQLGNESQNFGYCVYNPVLQCNVLPFTVVLDSTSFHHSSLGTAISKIFNLLQQKCTAKTL